MKKIAVFVPLLLIALTGCLNSDEEKTLKKIEGFTLLDTEEFSLQVADGWETLTEKNFTNGTPKNTVAAFRSNIRNAKFTANVVVIKNSLAEEISSLDYAKALSEKIKNDLQSARGIILEKNSVAVEGKEYESFYSVVEGKNQSIGDIKRFIHTSATKGKTAFVVMGSYLVEEGEGMQKKIEATVRSLAIK